MWGRSINVSHKLLGSAAVVAMLASGGAAHARSHTTISPYLEVDQTVVGDLKGGDGDVMSYTSLVAGVSATITTRRAAAQIDAQYEHQFGWNRNTPDQDVISGIASARFSIVPDHLSIEGGALATRARTDGFTGANSSLAGSGASTTQVYSAYVGPTFTGNVGAVSLNAAYRFGYSRVEDDINLSGPAGLGAFSDSVFHSATASVGMQPGRLPFGWSLGAGYDREDASELDQRYEDKWGRADVTVPVTPTLAAIGGVGYESIKISQKDALRDGAGLPVVDGGGHFVTDPASPRLLAYDNDAIMWDAGVLWRPSRRTTLELRVGRRYDSMHYVGSFSWQPSAKSSFNLALFDTIDSFGRAMGHNLDNLPTAFNARRNPFSGDLTGCVNGNEGGGSCFNDSLSGITTANYRHRGIAAQYSRTAGRWSMGGGAGYSQRKFLAPNSTIFAAINGAKDENYYADLFAGYQFDNDSNLDATFYGNYFNSGLGGVDVANLGSYVTYSRSFGKRLSAQASVGIDSVDPVGLDAIISGLGQVGMRYQF